MKHAFTDEGDLSFHDQSSRLLKDAKWRFEERVAALMAGADCVESITCEGKLRQTIQLGRQSICNCCNETLETADKEQQPAVGKHLQNKYGDLADEFEKIHFNPAPVASA